MNLMANPKEVCKKILYKFHVNIFHVQICVHECILDISTVVGMFVLVYMCVVVCKWVYLCVFVWISVFVWERWTGACEAVARVMTAVKREQLSSSLQELTILSCLLQKYINFVLLNSKFKVHLASRWLFIKGHCFF